MAQIFGGERIVPVWLLAARHLDARKKEGRTDRNLVLDIEKPITLTSDDIVIIKRVDSAIHQTDPELSVATVAGTIFPLGLYRRYGRPEFYGRFADLMKRGKKPGTWGTYAMRMFSRRGTDGRSTFNPIDAVINKLHTAATTGKPYCSAYEMSVMEPSDLEELVWDFGCELPTFDQATDGNMVSNMPCLSHLSFKLNRDRSVDLTAVYRSHYYAQRALGNLIGLSQLQSFVAREAKLTLGRLTCVSTHAVLDVSAWGGAVASSALLTSVTQ